MSRSRLTPVRNRIASLTQIAHHKFPVPAALAGLSFAMLEQLGERATKTRKRRIGILSLIGVMMMVTPVAAQVDCSSGFLQFIGFIRTLSIQAVGMFFIVLVLAGIVLKALPVSGTDRAGNAVLGGVVVAVVFLVLALTLIDLADTAAGGSIELDSTCSAGGGGDS